MKRAWYLGILALSSVVQAGTPLWWPLQQGNSWVLQSTNNQLRTIACPLAFGKRTVVDGLFPAEVSLRYGSPGLLYGREVWPGWQPVFRFNRRVGKNYWFNLTGQDCDTFQATWTSNEVDVVTPAGTFTNCRHLLLTLWPGAGTDCAPVEPSELWFAAGVGPVALRSANGELFLLSAANGIPTPTNGITATLTSDYDSYVNSTGGFYCPPCTTNVPPCMVPCIAVDPIRSTARFTFDVTNQSTNPVTFTFPTGQQFDIELRDTNDVVAVAWSDGKVFPMVVTSLTFNPGETRSFTGNILLNDRKGQPLAGTYVARAWLTNYGGPAAQATKVITVHLIEPDLTWPVNNPTQ